MVKRDYEKLLKEYDKKFSTAPARNQRGQLYVCDFFAALKAAGVKDYKVYTKTELIDIVYIVLKAGIMIGYKACQADQADKRRKARGQH